MKTPEILLLLFVSLLIPFCRRIFFSHLIVWGLVPGLRPAVGATSLGRPRTCRFGSGGGRDCSGN